MPTLFEDFLQSGENWLNSSLMFSLTRSQSQKRRGRHVLLPYHEVKKKFGAVIATTILSEKKQLEQNKNKGDATIYFMPHPEAPNQEETCLQYWRVVFFFLFFIERPMKLRYNIYDHP